MKWTLGMGLSILLGCLSSSPQAQCLSATDCFYPPYDPFARALRSFGQQPAVAGIAGSVLVAGGIASALMLKASPADLPLMPNNRRGQLALLPPPELRLPNPPSSYPPIFQLNQKATTAVMAVTGAAILTGMIVEMLKKK